MLDPHPAHNPDHNTAPACDHAATASQGLTRRGFFTTSAVGLAAAGGALTGLPATAHASTGHASTGHAATARRAAARSSTARGRGNKATNVIFMVSDGMSAGTLTLAEIASRMTRERESRWVGLWREKGMTRAAAATYAADSLVTDSAAAGSAWGCGLRVNNNVLNITPDGRQQMPILVRARQQGKGTGLVSTARITHATPASFLVNCVRRDYERVISEQMLERDCDVLLGGGARYFPEEVVTPYPKLRVVRSADQLRSPETARHAGPLLGLYNDSHVAYEMDRPDNVPTLAEMTRVALSRLSATAAFPEGFVLQIEGGRIDHAAHNNDAAALVTEQLAFDDALGVVWEFTENRDDTLVIATSDHGNANPGLTLYGRESFEGLKRLLAAKGSFDVIFDRLLGEARHADRPDHLPKLVAELRGIEFDREEREMLAAVMKGRRQTAFRELSKVTGVLGGLLANYYGVGFVSGNHTSDLVEVLAWGPGSELVLPMGHNSDLHEVMTKALALAPGKRLPDMDEVIEFGDMPSPD